MLKLSNAQMYEITDDLQAYAQKDSFVSITNRIHKQYQTVLERNVQEAEQCKIAMQNIKTKEQAQVVPSPCTSYAMFYNGKFLTNEQFNDKRFLKMVQQK